MAVGLRRRTNETPLTRRSLTGALGEYDNFMTVDVTFKKTTTDSFVEEEFVFFGGQMRV